jgi:hypothetical protein
VLKFDTGRKAFEKLEATELKAERILERYDLQAAIANSWDLFKNELGLPNAFLIGEEINPDPRTQDSVDLLAYDSDDSSLVVIELKRARHKLQLLQAISYAAMVSQWDADTLISRIQEKYNPDIEELKDLITGSELSSDTKIILIAETFDPEVIIASDWLTENYSLNISAFSIALFAMGKEKFLSLEQRYPLKELSDVYVERGKRRRIKRGKEEIQWEDVLPKLEYPFASRGIELCKRIREGDPSRRRFTVRSNYDGFDWISLNFRAKYINVYMRGNFEGNEKLIQSKFREEVPISSWRDGLSFRVTTESQFEDLVKWLKLESP